MFDEFAVHTLTEDGLSEMKRIAELFDIFLKNLLKNRDGNNANRYEEIARTKLEEACFFFKKSIAIQRSLQKKQNDA